jgi:hypothetical protein
VRETAMLTSPPKVFFLDETLRDVTVVLPGGFSLRTGWSMQNIHLRPPKAWMLRNLLPRIDLAHSGGGARARVIAVRMRDLARRLT